MVLKRAPKRDTNYESNYNRGNNTYSNPGSSNKEEEKTSGKEIAIAIACVLGFILFIIIFSSSNNSSDSSSSYTSSSYSKSNTNNYEKDGKCKGSDGRWYNKPIHGYCDGGMTPLGWKCVSGYKAKSIADVTSIDEAWYCMSTCKNFSCPSSLTCWEEKNNIPKNVNLYNSYDIGIANLYVELYNKCLSDKCSCDH